MIFWCLNVGNSIDLGKSYYKDNQVIDNENDIIDFNSYYYK